MFNILVKMDADQKAFLQRVREAMQDYFGADQRRIDHALQVSCYAEELLSYIDADPVTTLAAAYLHDIGIQAAEEKHGKTSGNLQEKEGPPIAQAILEKLNAPEEMIAEVCDIIAHHHHPRENDSMNFKVLYDADFIENLDERRQNASLDGEDLSRIIENSLLTSSGKIEARKLFLESKET